MTAVKATAGPWLRRSRTCPRGIPCLAREWTALVHLKSSPLSCRESPSARAVSGVPVWIDAIMTGIVVSSGTKPLYAVLDVAGRSTPDRVLRAEGMYEDFVPSGMTDLRAFIMQDYLGAASSAYCSAR